MNLRRIAELAGTSHTTVSRALNNSPLVARETRERIVRIAEELGYQINAGARGLSTGVRMTVGLLYSYHPGRQIASFYTAQLMHLMGARLAARGFDMMIEAFDPGLDDLTSVVRMIRQKKADGLLVIGYDISEKLATAITSVTNKCVFVNPAYSPWIHRYPAILIDHRWGGKLAADAFRKRGRRRCAAVAEDDPQFAERVSGFAEEFERDSPEYCGTASQLVLRDGTYETAYALAESRLAELASYDGIFVASDVSAIGVMNALLDNGIPVPDQVGIIGYDDVEWIHYTRPPLTTVHQPKAEVAEAAAAEIVERVFEERTESSTHFYKPELVWRGSV